MKNCFLTLILRSRPQVGFTRFANLLSISGRPEIEGGVSKDEGEETYAKTGFLVLRDGLYEASSATVLAIKRFVCAMALRP